MKKTLIITAIAAVLGTGIPVKAKVQLKIFPENEGFKSVQYLPVYRRDVTEGVKTYTVKVLESSKEKVEDYYVFDKPVIVKQDLYTYSTQKLSNDLITKENENSLLFLENVRFKEGAVLNLRTNMDERLSDFVNFHNITLDNGQLLIRIIDSSTVPRFVKTPLFVLPSSAEHAEVKMISPLFVSGVQYALKKEKIKDYLLFYVEPLYPTEEIAEKFAMYENSLPKEKRIPKEIETDVLLREKITIVKEGKMIYSSNIVDIFVK